MCAIVVGMPCASRSVEGEPAEGALVDEAQLGAAVGEAEPGVQVLLVGRGGVLDEQLAAHPEVQDQAERVAQVEPEVLAAPAHGGDAAPGEAVGEVLRAGDVAAGDPVAAQLDVGDGAAERRGRRGRGGRPRPRAAQARPAVGPSGSSCRRRPRARRLLGADDRALVRVADGGPGQGGGLLLGDLLGAAGAGAEHVAADDDLRLEPLGVLGAVLGDAVLGRAQARGGR